MKNKSTKKEDNNCILVWVTNPDACSAIVFAGKKLSEERSAELVIVNIQQSFTQAFKGDNGDTLQKLSDAAHSVGAELTVVYSDNSMQAAFNTISKLKPLAMVAGMAGSLSRESFIDQIYIFAGKIPTYSVDKMGNIVRIDF